MASRKLVAGIGRRNMLLAQIKQEERDFQLHKGMLLSTVRTKCLLRMSTDIFHYRGCECDSFSASKLTVSVRTTQVWKQPVFHD